MGIGLATLYSASNESTRMLATQGAYFGIGLGGLWLVSRFPAHVLKQLTPPIYVASLLPLVLVLFIGSGKYGNHWINLGFFNFQPSELAKLALVPFLAWQIDRRQELINSRELLLPVATVTGALAGLIVLQPDLGTAMLIAATAGAMLFLAGLAWRFLAVAAAIAAPLVWLLDNSSALVVRLLGLNRESEDRVTAEELHLIVAEASKSGVIEESERAIISGVVRLADRPVREVMTPRKDVDWIDAGLDARGVRDKLLETPHSRLPVARGSVDDIVGVVQARDIAAALFQGETLDLEQLMRPTKVIHDQIDAMDALEALRVAEVPMLLVHDEYGHFDGLVTPADLLSAIAGEFASDQDIGSEPFVVERDDGSLLIAGSMPADQMAERLGIELGEDRDYATAAGHVLAILKHLPTEGEKFTDRGWRFEIIDMDGRKIDKLLVTEIRKPKDAEAE